MMIYVIAHDMFFPLDNIRWEFMALWDVETIYDGIDAIKDGTFDYGFVK